MKRLNLKSSKIKNWGFIGTGHLAASIISAAVIKKAISEKNIFVVNRSPQKALQLKRSWGVTVCKNIEELVDVCDVVVLGTKPQDLLSVLTQLQELNLHGKTVISLAAGADSILLKKYLNAGRKPAQIVRLMANTPVAEAAGLYGVYFLQSSKNSDRQSVIKILETSGKVIEVFDDSEMDLITAASASGVGFVFRFMAEFEKWLVQNKFPRSKARTLVDQTFLGAAILSEQRAQQTYRQLLKAVTSKKGTTLAGLKALDQNRVPAGLQSGLKAARRRARELAKSLRRAKV